MVNAGKHNHVRWLLCLQQKHSLHEPQNFFARLLVEVQNVGLAVSVASAIAKNRGGCRLQLPNRPDFRGIPVCCINSKFLLMVFLPLWVRHLEPAGPRAARRWIVLPLLGYEFSGPREYDRDY